MSELTKEKVDLNKKAEQIEARKGRGGKRERTVRLIAVTGVLSAAAFVLQYLEIGLPIMPYFIKFDFSDLPALLGAFALGPVSGIVIEFIKNLLHCAVSQSFTVGELSNFILGAVFVGIAGAIYRRKKSKKSALIGSLLGAAAMALVSFPSNYFIVYPFYYLFMGGPDQGPLTVLKVYQAIMPAVKSIPQALLVFNVPFTFAKGMLSVFITFLIYKPLSPLLHGRRG